MSSPVSPSPPLGPSSPASSPPLSPASSPALPPSNPPLPPPVVSPVSPPTTPPPVSPPTTPPPVSPPTPTPVIPPPPPPSPVSPPVSPPSPTPVPPPSGSPPPPTPSDSPPPTPSDPPPPTSTPPPPTSTPPPPISTPPPSNPFPSPASEPSPPQPAPTYQPPPPPPPPSSRLVSTGLIAGIAGGLVGAALLLCLVILILRKRRRDDDNSSHPLIYRPSPSPHPASDSSGSRPISITTIPQNNPLSPAAPPAIPGGPFSYEDLESATNGFAASNVLGQGGFGIVYRGTLSGKEVAIKKLKLGGGQGDREFRAEVEIISRVHHRNLVSLVGYCTHEDQRLLVYEYVPNKTLAFHLHGSGRPALDWVRRWKIALGSAKGLAYLHEDCDPKIIHRDIKGENILLDYNFEPKVADFGLAKFVPTNMSHVSSRIVGTFGYLAPEYVNSGKVTDRSDVYSYGVMLLELITGRKPIMGDPYVDQSLVDWARPLLQRAVAEEIYDELIDKWLETSYDQYDMKRLIHCAAAAVRHSAKKRPRMSQIVRYLEGEISLEDLNAGMKPGNSEVKSNSSEQEALRRMAFCGIISEEYAESDRTSEFEATSSSGATTEEMEQQRLSRKQLSGLL